MKPQELRELLNKPPEPGRDFIEPSRIYENEILNGYTMETVSFRNGLDKFCPAKMGQLSVIVGHPNVGKTTVMLWKASLLAKQNKKILIYSAENRISQLHKSITRFYTGKENIGADELSRTRELFRYIRNERSFSYKEIIQQSTYLLDEGFDWDFFLIDPYNSLRIDNPNRLGIHDYHYEAADHLRRFCMKTNKSIYLNTHTLTEAQREKLDANGERKAPMASMTEGGGKWVNKSDDVFVYHRNPKSKIEGRKFITELHVDKIRNDEFGGRVTQFDEPILLRYRLDRTGFDILLEEKHEESIKNMTIEKLPF